MCTWYVHLVKFVKTYLYEHNIYVSTVHINFPPKKTTLEKVTKLYPNRRIQDPLPPFLGMWMPQDENVGTVDPWNDPFIVFKGGKRSDEKDVW